MRRKKYANEPYSVYDPTQIIIDELDYYRGLWESGEKDEVMEKFDIPEEMRDSDFDDIEEIIENFMYNDDILFDIEWENFKNDLQSLIDKYQTEYKMWYISAEAVGWRNLSGEKVSIINDVDDIFKLLPDTDMSLYLFDDDGYFHLKVFHHDSPTGEFYYFYPAKPKFEEGDKVIIEHTNEEGEVVGVYPNIQEGGFDYEVEIVYDPEGINEGDVEYVIEDDIKRKFSMRRKRYAETLDDFADWFDNSVERWGSLFFVQTENEQYYETFSSSDDALEVVYNNIEDVADVDFNSAVATFEDAYGGWIQIVNMQDEGVYPIGTKLQVPVEILEIDEDGRYTVESECADFGSFGAESEQLDRDDYQVGDIGWFTIEVYDYDISYDEEVLIVDKEGDHWYLDCVKEKGKVI